MRSILFALVTLIGCSSSEPPAASSCTQGASQACACTDGRSGAQTCNANGAFDPCVCTGGTDSAVDTSPDPATDTGPVLCDQDLPTDFACVPPAKKATPSTSCSESQLQAMVDACITDPLSKVPSTCAAWKAANADCNTCVAAFAATYYAAHVIPERDMCYWVLFDDTCDQALNCSFECQDAVCETCDNTLGTGADGKTSEYRDCSSRARSGPSATKPKGRCYDIASKKASECLAATDYTVCIIDALSASPLDVSAVKSGVVEFLRGACRDGGDWSNRFSPIAKGSDAGVSDASDASGD